MFQYLQHYYISYRMLIHIRMNRLNLMCIFYIVDKKHILQAISTKEPPYD